MQKLLLTVEQVFTVAGCGVIVEPKISQEQVSTLPNFVILKQPNGTTVITKAAFHIEHIQTRSIEQTLELLKKRCYTCLLQDIDQGAVPIGTEIWIE